MIDPTKWNYILQLDTIKLYPIRRYGMKSSTTLELKKGLNENITHTHIHNTHSKEYIKNTIIHTHTHTKNTKYTLSTNPMKWRYD